MKTILIIDDDALILDSLRELLEVHGFRALTANSGSVGLYLAAQQQPDLILCDVRMPEMDGYTVLQNLRQTPTIQTIPFVFLTAHTDNSSVRQGMNLGADDYLSKPCSSQELISALNTRLRKQAAVNTRTQQALDSLRSSIASSLPHEFRTPLTGIFTSVELLRLLLVESEQASELESIADTIQSSAQRLHRLIQNYLTYSKLEISIRDPNYKSSLPQDVTLSPQATIAELAADITLRSNRLEDLHLNLQNAAIAFPLFEFQKVMLELLDNAVKFSFPNSPIHVSSTITANGFHIRITNWGRGMTADQIAALGGYMQFNRDVYEQQGVGLGLAIAQRLLELHNATLTLTSIPHETTTVTVVIPLAPEEKGSEGGRD